MGDAGVSNQPFGKRLLPCLLKLKFPSAKNRRKGKRRPYLTSELDIREYSINTRPERFNEHNFWASVNNSVFSRIISASGKSVPNLTRSNIYRMQAAVPSYLSKSNITLLFLDIIAPNALPKVSSMNALEFISEYYSLAVQVPSFRRIWPFK